MGKQALVEKKPLRKLGFNRILHESTLRYEDLKLISTNAPGQGLSGLSKC
jgi:hypothetical protein